MLLTLQHSFLSLCHPSPLYFIKTHLFIIISSILLSRENWGLVIIFSFLVIPGDEYCLNEFPISDHLHTSTIVLFILTFFVSEPPQSCVFLNNPVFYRSPFYLACSTYRCFYPAIHYFFPGSLGLQNNLD